MASRSPAIKPARRQSGKRRGATPWLQGLAGGAVVALATPTAAVAGALLVPALVTFMLDAGEGRALTRTLALSGLAASAQPLMTLWTGGNSIDVAMTLISDPGTLALAWAAQAAGWLLSEALPLLITASLNAQISARSSRLRGARGLLEKEWSLPAVVSEHDVSAEPPA